MQKQFSKQLLSYFVDIHKLITLDRYLKFSQRFVCYRRLIHNIISMYLLLQPEMYPRAQYNNIQYIAEKPIPFNALYSKSKGK